MNCRDPPQSEQSESRSSLSSTQEHLEYLYHIYGMAREDSDVVGYYAIDNSRTYSPWELGPLQQSELGDLAKGVFCHHLDYLRGLGIDEICKENMFLSFSFTSPCDAVMSEGVVYRTQRLSGDDQKRFFKGISGLYNMLSEGPFENTIQALPKELQW